MYLLQFLQGAIPLLKLDLKLYILPQLRTREKLGSRYFLAEFRPVELPVNLNCISVGTGVEQ